MEQQDMSYVHIRSEPGLWTVGHYDGGEWEPESDHTDESKAVERVHYLNGGTDSKLKKRIAELEAENAKLQESHVVLADFFEKNIIAMQAAWIEWQHGNGAEEAMQWIHNTIAGPGNIPEGETDAQAFFDKAVAPIDARAMERIQARMDKGAYDKH